MDIFEGHNSDYCRRCSQNIIKTICNPPVRMAIIKSLQTINAREVLDKREPSYTVGGNENWYSYYGEQYGGSLKKTKNGDTIWSSNSISQSWEYAQRKAWFERIHAPQWSLQHHLQQPRHGSNRNVHWQMNGWRRCTYIHWNITQS